MTTTTISTLIPQEVRVALEERYNTIPRSWTADTFENWVNILSPKEMLATWLDREGIFGYSEKIWGACEALQQLKCERDFVKELQKPSVQNVPKNSTTAPFFTPDMNEELRSFLKSLAEADDLSFNFKGPKQD